MFARLALAVLVVGCGSKKPQEQAKPTASASVLSDAASNGASSSSPAASNGSSSSAVSGQRTLADELETFRAANKLPALAAVVWRDGKLVDIAAVGLRKADDPASKVTTADQWHLGSNTKAMTATLIAMYVDRGVLAWDDTLAKLFKGTKLDPGYAQVTLDQLLHHEGGAPGVEPRDLWEQLRADGEKPDARAKFVAGVLARPPAQQPGTFVYSNAGYMIAGAALERATGKRWEQLMRDELFGKLDMRSCGFGAPGGHTKGVVDQPWGHDADGKPVVPGPAADNPPGLGPAGTVHCSLEDYGKFLALHATGTPALLSAASLEHLHSAPDKGYAGGWTVFRSPRGTLLGHSGSNTMWFLTAMVVLADKPDDRVTIVVATNVGNQATENVALQLLARHVGKKPAP